MATAKITVSGRLYEIACDDGQEAHIGELGAEIDRRASALSKALGPMSDAKLLMLVCLVMADEAREGRPHPVASGAPDLGEVDRLLAEGIETLTRRLEGIAERLEKA